MFAIVSNFIVVELVLYSVVSNIYLRLTDATDYGKQ